VGFPLHPENAAVNFEVSTVYMLLAQAPDLNTDDYLVLGLATCFLRTEDGVVEQKIIEPIPSAALEVILENSPTSYEWAIATTVGEVLTGEVPQLPAGIPAPAPLGADFVDRAIAAARTYQRKPSAQQFIPVGTTYTNFNYSIERKRVLNADRRVSKTDNVKQHAYTHQKL
jgi:hypothetical protein